MGSPGASQGELANARLHAPRIGRCFTGQLLREHLREPRGRHRIHDDDRPQRTPLGTLQILARAQMAGPHIGAFCQAMHREQGQNAVRRMQGLLSFHKKYGTARLEEACAAALEMDVYDYRFVRRR